MTLTNSDRQQVQLLLEAKIGCNGPDELRALKDKFLSSEISLRSVRAFEVALDDDATSLYAKASQTFLQGVEDLQNGYQAWAVIKLYYATYYFLRFEICLSGTAIIRCPDICTLDISIGSSPKKWARRNRNNDHKATIDIYSKLHGAEDLLSSQNIEESNPYEWLGSMREWANYRSRSFPEVNNTTYFYSTSIWPIDEQIDIFIKDDLPIYCFDPDFACLALPLKRALNSSKKFKQSGLTLPPKTKKFLQNCLKRPKIPNSIGFLCPQ